MTEDRHREIDETFWGAESPLPEWLEDPEKYGPEVAAGFRSIGPEWYISDEEMTEWLRLEAKWQKECEGLWRD